MDILCKTLSRKVEFITSPLYGLMSWTSKLPISLAKIPDQPQPSKKDDFDPKVGLKILIHSDSNQAHDTVTVSFVDCFTPTRTSERSMFTCSVMDDLIGTESGDSVNEDDLKGIIVADEADTRTLNKRNRNRAASRREYPPPLSLFAERGRNSWVLKRECFDGRLMVRAERVKHHQHLEAHRENGRLVMKLVTTEEEEGTEERCDELGCLEKESGVCVERSVSYSDWIVKELEVPMSTRALQDSANLRPVTTVM